MSQSDLVKALREQVAFDGNKFHGSEHRRGGKRQHEQLMPLLEHLFALVKAADTKRKHCNCQLTSHPACEFCDALADLRAAVLPTKPKYNWESTGPGGCDSHNVEHPCGKCLGAKRE